jgi:dolichol-phosphate mannosyltransferase
MSGFFMVSRTYLEEVVRSLSATGFKVLLDLLASSQRPARFAEVGYTFRNRTHGESKLSPTVCLEYLELVIDKLIGDWIPVRYAFFGLVGAIGVLAQLVLVGCFLYNLPFVTAQAAGSIVVMFLNYFLNNRLTFRSSRLQGWAWISGLLTFLVACSIGLFCNVKVAEDLHRLGLPWAIASGAGIFAGSIWNYGVSSILVWRVNRRYRRVLAPQIRADARMAAIEAASLR